MDRRDPAVLARVAEAQRLLREWWNEDDWEFERNGERWLVETFADWWAGDSPVEVWDVGAHRGEWAEAAYDALARRGLDAQITSFELVPELAGDLGRRTAERPWHTAVASGLSDAEGSVTIGVTTSTTTAIHPRRDTKFHDETDPVVACPITTGDAHLAAGGRPAPALLKIDTEGHEAAVLRGCRGLLARPDGPVLIQFEYGDTWIPAAANLHDVQGELESLGYAVGRLFPDHVGLKRWERGDDHFRMGNMVAVRDDALAARLRAEDT